VTTRSPWFTCLFFSALVVSSLAGGTLCAQTDALRRDSSERAATASRIIQLEARLAQERAAREYTQRRAEEDLRNVRRFYQRDLGFAAALIAVLLALAFYLKRTEESRSARQWGITDPLTGARNRRYIEQTIAADMAVSARRHVRATNRGERAEDSDLVFLLFDLDHFKEINDQHGHMVGDDVLKQIVKRLETVCRQSDVICRWGGEEFLVVGRFTDRALAPVHAERIRRGVESCEIRVDGHAPLHVTCSVGYASYPFRIGEASQESWLRLIALADQATYISKRSGRNRSAGLLAGPHAEQMGNAAVTPDMVKQWLAEDVLVVEQDFDRDSMVVAR
jgi:diguanylate cyclase (GGDEF)-like protein